MEEARCPPDMTMPGLMQGLIDFCPSQRSKFLPLQVAPHSMSNTSFQNVSHHLAQSSNVRVGSRECIVKV
jgi:hypothetical protein